MTYDKALKAQTMLILVFFIVYIDSKTYSDRSN